VIRGQFAAIRKIPNGIDDLGMARGKPSEIGGPQKALTVD
jgi:hypothetical protein